MSKKRVLQLYQGLNDEQKQIVVGRLRQIPYLERVSKGQVVQLLEGTLRGAPRLYQDDMKVLLDFMEKKFPLKKIVQAGNQLRGVSANVGSFLGLKQLKSLSQVSKGARRSVYHGTLPTLQRVSTHDMKNPRQFVRNLQKFTSLRELVLDEMVALRGRNADALRDALPHLTQLRALHIDKTNLDKVVFPSLAGLTSLKVLSIDKNPLLGDDGITELAKVLPHLKKLQYLYLSNTGVGDGGAVALARALPALTALRTLSAHMNNIGNIGAAAIADKVREGQLRLKSLMLGYNQIGDQGVLALVASVFTEHLENFSVGSLVTDVGLRSVAQHLPYAPNMTDLDLGGNHIRDIGILAPHLHQLPKLMNLVLNANEIQATHVIALADHCHKWASLSLLNIDDNELGDEGVAALCAGICKMPSLMILQLSGVGMTDAGARRLAHALTPCIGRMYRVAIADNHISLMGQGSLDWMFGEKISLDD